MFTLMPAVLLAVKENRRVKYRYERRKGEPNDNYCFHWKKLNNNHYYTVSDLILHLTPFTRKSKKKELIAIDRYYLRKITYLRNIHELKVYQNGHRLQIPALTVLRFIRFCDEKMYLSYVIYSSSKCTYILFKLFTNHSDNF